MNRRMIFRVVMAVCCLATLQAQTPRWVDKAKKAVLTITTYDRDGKLLATTHGFYAGTPGIAVSDYTSFKGAARATAIDSEGKEYPITAIMGASSIYDVVKLQVEADKKAEALSVAPADAATGETVYLLPYSTKKERNLRSATVKEVTKATGETPYYTLTLALADNQTSCPIVNANGEVLGIAQKGTDAATCYAVGIALPIGLATTAFDFNNLDLRDIYLPKALPDKEEDAELYLLMVAGQMDNEEYGQLIDRFIASYPNSDGGYIRRATHRLATDSTAASRARVTEDMKQALSLSQTPADVHYNYAKLIYSYILQSGNHDEPDWSLARATEEIDAAVAADPMPLYYDLQGDIRFAAADYTGAYTAYETVSRSPIGNADTFYKMAKAKQMAGADLNDVIVWMDSCINRVTKPYSQGDEVYLIERAQMYMDTQQYRKALVDFDEYYVAANGQVNDLFYYYREQAAVNSRQYQRALDDISKAISLAPDEPLYRLELGATNLRVGRYQEAIEALQASIAREPTGDAYRLMGMAQVQLGQKAAACDNFEKAKAMGDAYVDALIEKNCK